MSKFKKCMKDTDLQSPFFWHHEIIFSTTSLDDDGMREQCAKLFDAVKRSKKLSEKFEVA